MMFMSRRERFWKGVMIGGLSSMAVAGLMAMNETRNHSMAHMYHRMRRAGRMWRYKTGKMVNDAANPIETMQQMTQDLQSH